MKNNKEYMKKYMRKYRENNPDYVKDDNERRKLSVIKDSDKKRLERLNNDIKTVKRCNDNGDGNIAKDYYTLEELEE